jgi:hypothetical protein
MRRDAALILGALALCPLLAAAPLARTRAPVEAERALGLFAEPDIHAWVAARPALLTVAGLFYVWVHLLGRLAVRALTTSSPRVAAAP